MVASEAVPYAKTGGLGDVLGALPRALGRLGHSVDVVIPRYRGNTAGTRIGDATFSFDGRMRHAAVCADEPESAVRTVFIDAPEYFDRDNLYGTAQEDYPDNAVRFAYLAHAAIAFASPQSYRSGSSRSLEHPYDVAHAHDWQTGLVPVLASDVASGASDVASGFSRKSPAALPTVFTIHNLAYQGLFDRLWLPRIGLPPEMMRVDAMEYWGRLSFLKGGVVFARVITTVSPRYAQEIQTPEFGFGFDGILRERSRDLIGILNGIDYDQWDPQHDVHLPEPFSASNLTGKRAAKRRVLDAFRLPDTEDVLARPMVGMISRLVDQKGFDLIVAMQDVLPALGATLVLLGTGERQYEDLWRRLAAQHPDRIGARFVFDERLAHLIEGGADMLLMPSRFEPCGLNQMYSLRYGTVPVVRAVGGLADTVRNYDERTGEGTGFTFEPYTPAALEAALRRALQVYADPAAWTRIQQAGMREDHSWTASARQYVAVYERTIDTNRRHRDTEF